MIASIRSSQSRTVGRRPGAEVHMAPRERVYMVNEADSSKSENRNILRFFNHEIFKKLDRRSWT